MLNFVLWWRPSWFSDGQKNFSEGHAMGKKTFRGSCDGQKNFLDGHAMDKIFF
jgi:hypothetical protein